jgi:rhomboid protease GluP
MDKFNPKNHPVTLSLIVLNVIIFLIPLLFGINVFRMDVETMYNLGAMEGASLILNHEVWRLLSSMFLHANIEHLLMNMITLLFIGPGLERHFSKFIFLSIYFISGFISGLVPIYFQEPGTVSLGASGAIFGIAGIMIGFTIVHYKKMKVEILDYMKGYSIFLLINLLVGLSIPEVGFTAHLTGLLVGLLGGMGLHKKSYYYLFLCSMTLLAYLLYAYFLPSLYVNSTNVLF